MINKTIKKIHNYRVGFLVLISFMFLAYLGMNPINVSKYYGARFGSAIGMSVSIPENPINKVAVQLQEKEENLNMREQDLNKREQDLAKKPDGDRIIIWVMSAGIISLFILIVVNFYLDRRYRSKKVLK